MRVEAELLGMADFQGNAVVNYTDRESRGHGLLSISGLISARMRMETICPRRSSFVSTVVYGNQGCNIIHMNNEKNGKLYVEYMKLTEVESRVVFGSRNDEYKYYDMVQVITVPDMGKEELN